MTSTNEPVAQAATSNTLNFQARLQTNPGGAVVPDGFYNIDFKIYDTDPSTGSSPMSCTGDVHCMWDETYYDTNGVTAGNDFRVRVANGYVSVSLGSRTTLPGTINWDQGLFITMNVGGTAQIATPTWTGELSPRLKLSASAYAFRAGQLATNNGSYTSTLSLLAPVGNSQIFQIADTGVAGNNTYYLLTTLSGVLLQPTTPGTQQTSGNFNIAGTAIAGTALKSPLLDVASAGTLNIGTTTANAVTIGSTSLAGTIALGQSTASNTINIGNGAVTGAQTVNIAASVTGTTEAVAIGSTFNASTTAINAGSGGMQLQTNGSTTGTIVKSVTTDSSTALQVQNASGDQLLRVSTATGQVFLGKPGASGITGSLVFQNATNANTAIVQSGITSGSYALILPTALGVSGDCIKNSGTAGTLLFGACSNSGIATFGTIDTFSSPRVANGATILGSNLYLQTSDDTYPGIIDIVGTQVIAGAKTFTGAAQFINNTNSSTAFRVQNAASTDQVKIDTTTSTVQLGSATFNGKQSQFNAPTLIKQQTDSSTSAFEVQNAAATTSLIKADSTNGQVLFGTVSSISQIGLSNFSGGPGITGSYVTNSTVLPAAQGAHGSVVVNGYIYVVAGAFGVTNAGKETWYAKINANGSVGTWTVSGNLLPTAPFSSMTTTANGYIYYMGGVIGSTTQTTVYYTKVNSDGSIAPWQTNANALPVAKQNGGSITANGYVYVMGGQNNASGSVATVYYAHLNPDGSTSAWTTSANPVPTLASAHTTVVANGYVYLTGIGTGVAYAKLNANGSTSTWTTSGNVMPATKTNSTSVVANGYLYALGGVSGATYTPAVFSTKLNSDGSVGAWATNTSMPNGLTNFTSVIANGYIYNLGGLLPSFSYSNAVTYASTSRLSVAANLDLIGPSAGVQGDVNGDLSQGSVGGSIFAGNIFSNGGLQVMGSSQLTGEVGITGNLSQSAGNTMINGGSLCVKSTVAKCAGTLAGRVYATGAAVTGADYAENYVSSQQLEPGVVVSLAKDGDNQAVVASDAGHDAVLGVISTAPGMLVNSGAEGDAVHTHVYPIALAGRVPIKVSDQNGLIHAGDYLSASPTQSGIAIKATSAGQTIGKALEDDNGSGKVMTFINLTWADPGADNGWQSAFANLQSQVDEFGVLLNNGDLQATKLAVTGNASFSGDVTVQDMLSVASIQLAGHIITTGLAPDHEMQTYAGTGGEAAISGNDTTGTITVAEGTLTGSEPPGDVVKLNFKHVYGSKPKIILTTNNADTAQLGIYIKEMTTDHFTIAFANPAATGKSYVFSYYVFQ